MGVNRRRSALPWAEERAAETCLRSVPFEQTGVRQRPDSAKADYRNRGEDAEGGESEHPTVFAHRRVEDAAEEDRADHAAEKAQRGLERHRRAQGVSDRPPP